MIRIAISPRFAIKILLNSAISLPFAVAALSGAGAELSSPHVRNRRSL
jgi:hypothetical protein